MRGKIMKDVFEKVVADPRYQANLDWSKISPGHPEGTIRAHIAELEQNLEALKDKISEADYWKLKVLIHVHDTCKPQAKEGIPISHPQSHASLAKQFLSKFCSDMDLLHMLQYHDEGYALWLQYERDKRFSQNRFQALLKSIKNWDLFLIFNIIDGSTKGKSRDPLHWFITEVRQYVKTDITTEWIL
jgi:hypothetical protein